MGVALMVAIVGCMSKPTLQAKIWKPNSQQVSQAEKIARRYAYGELGVTKDQLNQMKAVANGRQIEERKVIYLQFYDIKHFPDWENMSGVEGGFPHYFTIDIDISSWAVIDHYASPE